MLRLTDTFKNELMKFCDDNKYSYQKLLKLPKCGNSEMLFIQHYNPEKASKEGLASRNRKPAEIVLSVIKDDSGNVTIEKGVNADKYLSLY